LEKIGIKDLALRRGQANTDISFHNARTGKQIGNIKTNPNYTVCVNRQEFLADLASLLDRTLVLRQHLVTRLTTGADNTIQAHCEIGTASEPAVFNFDLVIAADGIQSLVRKEFFPAASQIYDRGFSSLYLLLEIPHELAPAHFSEIANGSQSKLIMGYCSTTTIFPMGHDRLAVGIGFDDMVKSRLWSEQGLPETMPWKEIPVLIKKSIALKLAADAPLFDSMISKAFELVPDWNHYKVYLWKMRDTDPLPAPYAKEGEGNFIAIGDAAHAIMPTIGMGASLAIEDAERLAFMLAAMIKKEPDVALLKSRLREELYLPYTKDRYPIWSDLVSRARSAANKNFTNISKRKRFAVSAQIPGYLPSRIVGIVEFILEKLNI